jgi:lipopolysaccharide/colanic/teichoic acid biosynthesis glycosyltransferase
MFTGLVSALRRAAKRSDRQRLRGVQSRRQFRRVLARERSRSDRSGDRFSLIVFSPRSSGSATVKQQRLVKYLHRRLRLTDEIGWLDGENIGVVLPATPPRGAWHLVDDVCRHFDLELRPICSVYTYPSESDELDRSIPENRRSGESELHPLDEQRPTHALELLFMKRLPAWKRLIDIAGATGGMILLSPLLIGIAVAIKYSSSGPVLFKQRRSGWGGRPFLMFKFRSMVVEAEAIKVELLAHNEQDGPAFKIKNDPRVTRLGRFLRRTSLDELPQLWNVVRGEMTLVGPRPLPCEEQSACSVWQRRRLDVTPGLTCIWQVTGRSQVSFNDWVRMDLEYVEKRSLWKDLKILIATLPAVLLRRGAQ